MIKNNVVAMGGGTGTFPVVTALKSLDFNISAIISVSDSGGSTGRIRDEFGFQPVGDLRQSLAALANVEQQDWIQKILLYRFSKGSGLKGHNLGNLILTALQDMSGNTTQALEIAEKVFDLDGSVIPVTATNVSLKIHYQDGTSVIGEHILDSNEKNPKKIERISLTPKCKLNPIANDSILKAKYIIIGPGDHFASILSTLVADGTKTAFKNSKAKIIYVANLMTRRTQTHEMTIGNHLKDIESAIGKKVNYILINDSEISNDVLKKYASEQEYPVVDDLNGDKRIIRAKLLLDNVTIQNENDTVHRSFLRHDSEKLKKVFAQLLK
ncbi:YvcK family protein [Candidatus Woesebacteria bacterium]|nr:YvcK family protein [Candidatus Woesebacteria bacterium]